MLRDHGSAVDASLQSEYGLSVADIRSGVLSPSRAIGLIEHLPSTSALTRAIDGVDHQWTLTNMLLADAVDALNLLVWAKTEDAPLGRNRPKPIPRPGVEDDSTTTYGKGEGLPIDEMTAWLGWSDN